jgi:predicted metal-binding protein
MTDLKPVEVLVCATCRAGAPTDQEGPRPGARLYEDLSQKDWPDHVTVTYTECLSNCDSGCSVAVRGGAERWTYVYGNFAAEDAELVHDGMVKYAATSDGLVPWRERSTHFKKNCIARIPPMETA